MKEIIRSFQDDRIISIIGNAKNAGKTTVLNHLVKLSSTPLAITSIGLDGEEVDQITHKEKPQVYVRKGDYVASAYDTLKHFTADYKIVEETSIESAIGRIVICEITKEGKALIAGPSAVDDMEVVANKLLLYPVDTVYIDGAFFRMSFAKVSHSVILVFGANYAYDMLYTIEHARLTYKKFSLPIYPGALHFIKDKEVITIINQNDVHQLSISSLIGSLDEVFSKINSQTKAIYLPKSLTDAFVKKLMDEQTGVDFDIIIESPVNIQLQHTQLKNLFLLNHQIYVINPISVKLVCLNPYSPNGYSYEKNAFKNGLKQALMIDVFNVEEENHNE